MISPLNQIKSDLISSISQVAREVGLECSPCQLNHCLIVSDGSPGRGDYTLNLANPVFKPWYDHLEEIANKMIGKSLSCTIPLEQCKTSIKAKTINFHLDRKVAIPLILRDNNGIPNDVGDDYGTQSSLLIVNVTRNGNLKQLTKLRIQYLKETISRLYQSLGCQIVERNAKDIKFNDDQQTSDKDKVDQDDNTIQIDATQYKSSIPFQLDEIKFTIEPSTRLKHCLDLINGLIAVEDPRRFTKIIVLIHINDWKICEKALIAWSILSSVDTVDCLNRFSLVPIADVTSDLSLDDISLHLEQTIKEQKSNPEGGEESIESGRKYPQDQVNCLVETCLRYMLISLSPKVFQKLDLDKHREALFSQYNYARLVSLIVKFNQLTIPLSEDQFDIASHIRSQQEWNLVFNHIFKYHALLEELTQSSPFAAHKIVVFLKGFVKDISLYYNSTRIITEINEKSLPVINARIVLMKKVKFVLGEILNLIGVQPVKYM